MQFERHIYEQQGVGLGLAIVQSIAEVCHGRFEVVSTPGEYLEAAVYLRIGE